MTDDGRPVGRDLDGIRDDIRALRVALAQARDRLDHLDVATIDELRSAARDLRLLVYRVDSLESGKEATDQQKRQIFMAILAALLIPILTGAVTFIRLTGG